MFTTAAQRISAKLFGDWMALAEAFWQKTDPKYGKIQFKILKFDKPIDIWKEGPSVRHVKQP